MRSEEKGKPRMIFDDFGLVLHSDTLYLALHPDTFYIYRVVAESRCTDTRAFIVWSRNRLLINVQAKRR